MQVRDLFGSGFVFFFRCSEDDVGVFDAEHGLVGGDDDDFEFVDLFELGGFGFSRTGHAAQLLIEAEVVLEGDGGEGLVFFADLYAFFGFDGLVQSVGPAAARHQSAGEGVDDDDFAVLDDVVHVALVERMGLDGGFDVVLEVPVFSVGDVADAEQLFDGLPALIGDADGAMFFVDDVIAGEILFAFSQLNAEFGLALVVEGFHLFAQFKLGNDLAHAGIFVGGLVGRAGDDERCPSFVDQDRIDFVDDGVVVAALHAILDVELHVVAQVVEAEFVVGAVGDVGGVGVAAFVVAEVVDDDADGEPEELVDLAHPFGVALGQVVVDRDDVDAVAGERVEIAGKGGDEGFAFAGFHFRDLALVQNHAADQLHVEVAHLDAAPAGFADDCEGFGQDLVESGALGGLDGIGDR